MQLTLLWPRPRRGGAQAAAGSLQAAANNLQQLYWGLLHEKKRATESARAWPPMRLPHCARTTRDAFPDRGGEQPAGTARGSSGVCCRPRARHAGALARGVCANAGLLSCCTGRSPRRRAHLRRPPRIARCSHRAAAAPLRRADP